MGFQEEKRILTTLKVDYGKMKYLHSYSDFNKYCSNSERMCHYTLMFNACIIIIGISIKINKTAVLIKMRKLRLTVKYEEKKYRMEKLCSDNFFLLAIYNKQYLAQN